MKANQYDGLQVENAFFYIPDFIPNGQGNLWTLHRVSKWTFSPAEEEPAFITFTAPETGTVVAPSVLVDALETDDVTAAIYQNGECVFGPIVAKKEVRQGIEALQFDVKQGDLLRFEIKTLGKATTADWPVSLFYANSWVKEPEVYLPSEAEECSRSEFFAGLAKDLSLLCFEGRDLFDDVKKDDVCYDIAYDLYRRGVLPQGMVCDHHLFPSQSINGYEALGVLVHLWESFRRPLKGETLLAKAEELGLPYYNGVLSPAQVKALFSAFNLARKEPVGRTAHGEYSPVYKGIIREDVDIQKLIEDAYFSGKSEVTIPEGVYRIFRKESYDPRLPFHPIMAADGWMRPHLCLNGMKNFTVRGYGVTLLFQDRPGVGVLISKAENITFEGITLDYEPLVYTQGPITAIDLKAGTVDFIIEDGYPTDFAENTHISGDFYKANGEIAMTTSSFMYSPEVITHIEGNHYRLTTEKIVGLLAGIEPRDYITFRGDRIANAFYVESTDGFNVTDVTVYTGNVGLSVSYGHETHRGYYTRYRNIPGPAPLGALTPRFNSTSGTAYHCTGMRQSFTATDCYVRNNGDDGTNIHGVHLCLAEARADGSYVIARAHNVGDIKAGETLRFYDPQYGYLDEAEVIEAERLPEDYVSPNKERLEVNVGVWTFRANVYYRVRTNRPVKNTVGGWVINANEVCNGFVLKRCQFIGGRARGILIRATGVVEDCKVYRRPIGLMAAPEMHWLEPDHVFGLTVRNTEISSCGFGRYPLMHSGATTYAYGSTKNRDIVFDHCTFRDNVRIQLHANKVDGLTIKDCHFEPSQNAYAHLTVDRGENVSVENTTFDGTLPVFMEESADARFWSVHKKGRWD